MAVANAALSVRNWREAAAVPASVGLSPDAATLSAKAAAALPLPRSVRRAVLEGAMGAAGAGAAAAVAVAAWGRRAAGEVVRGGRSLR